LKIELDTEKKIILVCIGISVFLILAGVVTADQSIKGNGIIISAFLIIFPLILFRFERQRTLKEIEEKFPNFLRDVVESIRSGMPFHKAIATCSKLEYGKLTKEVKKMSNQISWGLPVDKVLDQFTEKVKRSKKLFTSLKVLRESYLTGGDVVSTLESVIDNLNILEDSEKEKKTLLNQYVVLMYAVSFVFVGILIAINNLMVPVFQVAASTTEPLGLSNPCENNPNIICSVYRIPPTYIFRVKDPNGIGAYYLSIFFFMSMIVAISCGLVAGQISENSVIMGLVHSTIMIVIIFGALMILNGAGMLGA
jgi:flagellar protein FlaJ